MDAAIKVLIADDHSLFRDGLKEILRLNNNIKIIEDACSGPAVVDICKATMPDVVLMDIDMPEMNGIEATKIIKAITPEIGIIILTMHDDDEFLFDAIKAGCNGYFLKDGLIDELVVNIKVVADGGSLLDNPQIAAKVMKQFSKMAQDYDYQQKEVKGNLTKREIEILSLIASGLANKQIATALFISEKTVKNHMVNIYTKLECNDKTQAILKSIRLGLVDLDA